jgi:hypothetical protein
VNKNETKNFIKQYKNTVCLDDSLKPIKVLDCIEDQSSISCLIMLEGGTKKTVSPVDKIIPLKGRLKERDYNYIEARFNKSLH